MKNWFIRADELRAMAKEMRKGAMNVYSTFMRGPASYEKWRVLIIFLRTGDSESVTEPITAKLAGYVMYMNTLMLDQKNKHWQKNISFLPGYNL